MGNIVTFYSYVGGAGISMAVANTATLLTRWGYRTLMVDWNLESPGGLEQFFHEYTVSENVTAKEGVLDLLCSAPAPQGGEYRREATGSNGFPRNGNGNGKEHDATATGWKKSLVPLDLPEGDNRLELLTAGRRSAGAEYFKKVQGFNFEKFYAAEGGGDYIEQLRQEWKDAYDFVLVDCRSGITPSGSICTIQLPDILVLLLPTSEQGLTGAFEVARQVTKARRRLPFDRLELLTIPVPARFDRSGTVSYDQQEHWLDRFEKGGAEFYEDWLPEDFSLRNILNDTIIPYQAQFSIEESLPSLRRQVPARTGAAKAYESLTALLANDFQAAQRLHTDRESYINQAWKTLTLPMIKNLHTEWLKTKGESGKRADLSGGDYHGGFFVNARLSEAVFAGADLRSADFFGADVSEADFSKAHLEHAILKEVIATGANLERAILNKADLKRSQFSGASFRGASLQEALLIKTDLRSADFREANLKRAVFEQAQLYRANLKRASLLGATGLTSTQFKGVELAGAELPEKFRVFPGLRVAQRLSRWARAFFYLLLALCIYTSGVVLLKSDDALLLTNRSLGPLAGGFPAARFFFAAPALLVIMYALFLLLLQSLWSKFVELPASFPDGSTLNAKVSDWFVAAVAYPYFPGRAGAATKWRRLGLSVLTRGLVPLTLLLFWIKYLPLRDWRFNSFHIFLLAVTVALGWSSSLLGAKTLRTNNTGDHWNKEEQP